MSLVAVVATASVLVVARGTDDSVGDRLATSAPAACSTAPTFTELATAATGDNPRAVIVADLNGDGVDDLVATNNEGASVSAAIGDGDGTFADGVQYPVGANPYMTQAGDLTGDEVVDLVVADSGAAQLIVLSGTCA